MQKTLIIVLLVAVVALSGVVVYQKLTPAETTPIVVNQPIVNQPSDNCLKEGESGFDDNNGKAIKNCCAGLSGIYTDFDLSSCEHTISKNTPFICTTCGNGVCGTGENKCNCADCTQPIVNQPVINQPKTNCLKEGEIYGTGYAEDCCSGLNKIPNVFKTGTECSVSNGETAICAYCGNGVCGTGENQCNCPADCK